MVEANVDRLNLLTYEAVGKFRSVRRAIRRGHVSPFGEVYPKRPFGNTNTKMNKIKRQIYEQFKNNGSLHETART